MRPSRAPRPCCSPAKPLQYQQINDRHDNEGIRVVNDAVSVPVPGHITLRHGQNFYNFNRDRFDVGHDLLWNRASDHQLPSLCRVNGLEARLIVLPKLRHTLGGKLVVGLPLRWLGLALRPVLCFGPAFLLFRPCLRWVSWLRWGCPFLLRAPWPSWARVSVLPEEGFRKASGSVPAAQPDRVRLSPEVETLSDFL
jgi:hypothetical protein